MVLAVLQTLSLYGVRSLPTEDYEQLGFMVLAVLQTLSLYGVRSLPTEDYEQLGEGQKKHLWHSPCYKHTLYTAFAVSLQKTTNNLGSLRKTTNNLGGESAQYAFGLLAKVSPFADSISSVCSFSFIAV